MEKKIHRKDHKTKSWFFEESNKIDKPLAGLSLEGKNKQYRNEKLHRTLDMAEIKNNQNSVKNFILFSLKM